MTNNYDNLMPTERLEIELSHNIAHTRIEGSGLPLQRIAEIIADRLDKSEARALARYLEKIVN
jgi:hypothetical protein